jgi:uncharacterized membrane protein YgcG
MAEGASSVEGVFPDVTQRMLKAAFVGKEAAMPNFVKWFVKNSIMDYTEVAASAVEKAHFETAILEVMVSDNVEGSKVIGNKAALRKFYMACQDQVEIDRNPRTETATGDDDEPMPRPEEVSMNEKWSKRHNFELTDVQLLVAPVQGRMWRDFKRDPPQLSVLLAERLRPRSCISQPKGNMMAVIPGRALVAQAVTVDEVTRSFELYQRIRAYFMTLSQVSVERPEWFPLQTAMIASDQVLTAISNTYRGNLPPVEFLLEAWANTIHFFAETMRIQKKRTASDIIGALNTWDHWWKFVPSDSGEAVEAPAPKVDNRPLQNEMQSMRGQINHWKSEANKFQQQVKQGRANQQNNGSQQSDGPPPKKFASGSGGGGKRSGGGKGKGRGGGGKRQRGNR